MLGLARAVYLLAGAALFTVYLRLSETSAPNSDSAKILLVGSDLPHGHLPRALVRKYFGRPARIFHTGPYTVLVWDRNLLLSIPR